MPGDYPGIEMTKKDDAQTPPSQDDKAKKKDKPAGKLDKRAEALRQNLKRRKAHKKKS